MKTSQLLKGAFVGTLTIFLWNSTEWFNPLMKSPYKQVKNPVEYNKLIEEQMPEDGIYAWHANFSKESGILGAGNAFYFTSKAKESHYNPVRFIGIELATQFCIWFLVCYVLLTIGKTTYWKQIQLTLTIGFITIFGFLLPMWNWWAFSTEFVAARSFQMLAGWFLASTVLYFVLWRKPVSKGKTYASI